MKEDSNAEGAEEARGVTPTLNPEPRTLNLEP